MLEQVKYMICQYFKSIIQSRHETAQQHPTTLVLNPNTNPWETQNSEDSVLQRSRVGEGLSLVLGQLHLVCGEGPATVCITVHLNDGRLQAEVVADLTCLLHQVVIVGNLGSSILLVVLPLGVKELLQDFSEGLDLVLSHARLEVITATELLVELILCLLQQECLIF